MATTSKARPRRDKCMDCDKPPTKEVKWAEGMARAWFCDECFEKWEKNHKDDINWVHDVAGGEVKKAEALPWETGEIAPVVDQYRDYLQGGAQPEEAYDKMLEAAPPWFGVQSDEFGLFLVALHQEGLPVPDVRLRLAGEEQGARVPDPEWTAPELLDAWLAALSDWRSRFDDAPTGAVRV